MCRRPAVLAVLLLAVAGSQPLSAKTYTERLRFQRGKSAATVRGAVVRGDRDDWILGAKAGQRLTVKVTALEKNAAFLLRERKTGRTLPGAGEMDDATRFSGRLPRTGDYVIEVGGTRGNAGYTLHVTIR